MWVYAIVCRCLGQKDRVRPPVGGVTNHYESPKWVLGNKLRPFETTTNAHNH